MTQEGTFCSNPCFEADGRFARGDGPQDAFLLARPYYHAFKPDFSIRGSVKLVEVPFGDVDQFGMDCVPCYERALLEARRLVNIRALILCSPHNPLGELYRLEDSKLAAG